MTRSFSAKTSLLALCCLVSNFVLTVFDALFHPHRRRRDLFIALPVTSRSPSLSRVNMGKHRIPFSCACFFDCFSIAVKEYVRRAVLAPLATWYAAVINTLYRLCRTTSWYYYIYVRRFENAVRAVRVTVTKWLGTGLCCLVKNSAEMQEHRLLRWDFEDRNELCEHNIQLHFISH